MSKSQKTKLQKFVLALGIIVVVAALAAVAVSLVFAFTSVGNGYKGAFSPEGGDKPLLAYARFCNAIRKNLFGIADSYTPDASANSAFLLGVGCCIIGLVWLILAAVKKKFIHMLYFLASIAVGFVVSFGYFLGTRNGAYHWDYLNLDAPYADGGVAAKAPLALVINLLAYVLLVLYIAFFVLNLVSLIKIKPAKKAAEEEKKEEEKPAEEPKPEEKPAEEAKAEEKPVEEPKAEEKPAPVVAEQPKAEEKKEEEKPAEEPKAEEPKAEEKPEEKPAEEKKPAAKKAPAKKPAEKKEPAKKSEPKKEAKPAPEKKEESKAEKKAPAKKPAEKKEPAKKAEPKKEAPKAEPKKAEEKPAAAKAEKPTPRKDAPRSYHISQHPQGGWQVKGAGSDKALKRFPTQAEAIKYARELEKSSGVSFRVHSMKGKIRKA